MLNDNKSKYICIDLMNGLKKNQSITEQTLQNSLIRLKII